MTEISNTFDELEKALHQRKTALITEVENICSTKQKVSDLIHFKFDALKKNHDISHFCTSSADFLHLLRCFKLSLPLCFRAERTFRVAVTSQSMH